MSLFCAMRVQVARVGGGRLYQDVLIRTAMTTTATRTAGRPLYLRPYDYRSLMNIGRGCGLSPAYTGRRSFLTDLIKPYMPRFIFPRTMVEVEADGVGPRFDFKNREKEMDRWHCTDDNEIGGMSTASFEMTERGSALFSGYISLSRSQTPDTSNVDRTGFAAIRSKKKAFKSPYRLLQAFDDRKYELGDYDAIEMKVRGDGRAYVFNIYCAGFKEDDMFQAFVYTKGGPEWETIKIPFDSFFLTHRGYLQDRQMSLNRNSIQMFGVLLADRLEGPYALEIEYIEVVSSQLRGTLDDLLITNYKDDGPMREMQ